MWYIWSELPVMWLYQMRNCEKFHHSPTNIKFCSIHPVLGSNPGSHSLVRTQRDGWTNSKDDSFYLSKSSTTVCTHQSIIESKQQKVKCIESVQNGSTCCTVTQKIIPSIWDQGAGLVSQVPCIVTHKAWLLKLGKILNTLKLSKSEATVGNKVNSKTGQWFWLRW